ncbi:hypothetical protein HBA55_29745 [Pseudomaricurvus alkylphenolicus]|uniref:hypothetical protein n=1 Tax=Pseudomaricurvus alkylphenolicus TaxID=1306991 RepID=UPI0014214601|nr:hypothetical protein [Pseudomaricurvus alkylphenolicus]NIB43823.1 hypothetical protein [Pseudomaricurvus alkylphenolicus]
MDQMQQMGGAGTAAEAAESLTPEQMEQYKRGFQIGQKLLYDQGRLVKFGKAAQKDPIMGLAGTIVLVLGKIEEGLGELDIPVLLLLGVTLMSDIAEAFKEVGAVELSGEQVQQALEQAIGMWLRKAGNRYSEEQITGQPGQQQQPQQQPAAPQGSGGLLTGRA